MKHVLYHSFIACHNGHFDFVGAICKLNVLFHWTMAWEDDKIALQLGKHLKDDEAILFLGEHHFKFLVLPAWKENGLGPIYFDIARYGQYVAPEIMIIKELSSKAVVFNSWQEGTGCRSHRLQERHREVTLNPTSNSHTDAPRSISGFVRNWFEIKPEKQVPKIQSPGYWQKQGWTDHPVFYACSVQVQCSFVFPELEWRWKGICRLFSPGFPNFMKDMPR